MSDFKPIRKSSSSSVEHFKGRHRFEHWYIDNQVYFLTARCRDRHPAFAAEQAKQIFWDRFDHYAATYGFVPWITSLLDNHYHTHGYLRIGKNLGPMMQRVHGSVAKLVNDTLPERRVPFWSEEGHRDYFDGAIATKSSAGGRTRTRSGKLCGMASRRIGGIIRTRESRSISTAACSGRWN